MLTPDSIAQHPDLLAQLHSAKPYPTDGERERSRAEETKLASSTPRLQDVSRLIAPVFIEASTESSSSSRIGGNSSRDFRVTLGLSLRGLVACAGAGA